MKNSLKLNKKSDEETIKYNIYFQSQKKLSLIEKTSLLKRRKTKKM